MCWTYTYSMYTTRTLTRELCTVDCQPVIHAESVCRRPRCLPSPQLSRLQHLCFFVLFYFGRPLQKKKEKKKEGEPKKKILILDRCVTFVNETYWIPLCTTMLMISTKPTHCRKMSTSTLVYFVFRPITVHCRRLKAGLLFLKCRLKSKYKI